ncbi:adhesin [Streptomyces sp. A5-4]|uniref:adhesin n=1 Tax=Streptomyces sp. A5-4 TaxID=3384771 RepID=UPI003DA90ADD
MLIVEVRREKVLMVCERCGGGRRGVLPGMVCPECGAGADGGRAADGRWVARETMFGRFSTLTRARKVWVATGLGVALAVLVVSATLLTDSDSDGGGTDGPVGNADDAPGGAPTRIGPTGQESADPAGTPTPTSRPPKAPAKPPPPARGPSFTAWAGPGCPGGSYREFGRFENGIAAWYTVKSGGSTAGSCEGSFSAVPMSGAPDKDRGSSAVWSWDVGKGFDKCGLAVFVPKSDRDNDVAGNPTFYRVLADPNEEKSSYEAFAVRQTVHRGALVPVGSYAVKGGRIAIQLIDRGRDWGDAALVGAHHAAAQMKLTCRQ